MLLDVAAGLLDGARLRQHLLRLAAPTRAVALAFGSFAERVEDDVAAQRSPGRAGRTAVDAGAADADDETAIVPGIARLERFPALLITHWVIGHGSLDCFKHVNHLLHLSYGAGARRTIRRLRSM